MCRGRILNDLYLCCYQKQTTYITILLKRKKIGRAMTDSKLFIWYTIFILQNDRLIRENWVHYNRNQYLDPQILKQVFV